MLRYQKLTGVTLSNTVGLPTIAPRPEDVMATIPGWVSLIDPDFVAADGKTVRNRALPRSHAVAVNASINTEDWGSGQRAFGRNGTTVSPSTYSTGAIDPTQFSFFMPIKRYQALSSAQRMLCNRPSLVDVGDIAPHCEIGSGGQQLWVRPFHWSGVTQAARMTVTHDFTQPTLVMLTFSVARGLAVWANGSLIGENRDDKRPLTKAFGSGDWGSMWSTDMLMGMHGVLNVDLSAPENAGHRRTIEGYLMQKYGIS